MMEEARLSGRGGSVPAAAALAADPGPLAHMLTMRLKARLVVGHSGAGKLRLVLATRAKSVFRVQHLFCRFLAVTLLGS